MDDNLHLRYLDGPQFVRWLEEEEGIDRNVLTDSQKRRWYDWSKGGRADIYCLAVDRILTDHLISSRLIPDYVWAVDQRKNIHGRKSLPEKQQRLRREEGKLLLRAGCDPKEISKKLNVSITTVRNWRRAMRKEDAVAA